MVFKNFTGIVYDFKNPELIVIKKSIMIKNKLVIIERSLNNKKIILIKKLSVQYEQKKLKLIIIIICIICNYK